MRVELRDFRIDCLDVDWSRENSRCGDDGYALRLKMRVPSVDGGGMITVYHEQHYETETVERSRGFVPRAIRDAIVSFLEHEVDEKLHVDGKRLRDPHMAVGEYRHGSVIKAIDWDAKTYWTEDGNKHRMQE